MTIYWSEFSKWLECNRRWGYEYGPSGARFFEETPEILEGREIDHELGERLRRGVLSWKTGRKTVIKEYHMRYKAADAQFEWKVQQPFTRSLTAGGLCPPDPPFLGVELGCVTDALALREGWTQFVRELKVTGRPKPQFYLHQLLWNCWCAECSLGELDLIYRPNYERSDWAFERQRFAFEPEDFAALIAEVQTFLQARQLPVAQQPRNSRSCEYCPHVARCWQITQGGSEQWEIQQIAAGEAAS